MKNRFHFQDAMIIEIVSGNIEETINVLCNKKIELSDIRAINELCCRCEISRSDFTVVQSVCTSKGDKLSVIEEKGVITGIQHIRRHIVLTCWIAVSVLLFLLLPTRILFIHVIGNRTLNSAEVLSEAKSAGLSLGCSRKKLRSEEIKNAMIQSNAKLKWVGINTQGALATIAVRESEDKAQIEYQGCCDVVAAVDGIVDSIYSGSGINLCYIGKSVQKNEVLISGKNDVGLCTLWQHAKGEVYARTQRFICGILPDSCFAIKPEGQITRHFTLLFQKRSIKLWIGSGILPPGCGKIQKEYSLSFPGGFIAPISIRMDSIFPYELSEKKLTQNDAVTAIDALCRSYLSSELIAGKIETTNNQFFTNAGYYELQNVYHCHEMIGRIRPYEIGDVYEQNN